MDGLPPIRLLIALADGRHGILSDESLIERIAPPYYLFKDHFAEVVLATPLGGFPALSTQMRRRSHQDQLAQRFLSDRHARDDLADTLGIDQIVIDDFDAAFCIGTADDMQASDKGSLVPTVRSFLESGRPVALVPGWTLDLSSEKAMSGLVIMGDNAESSILAAHALLKVAQERRNLMASPI
ncbi:transporter [Rhizobium lusitanum]|uniref:Transporter n=1 Tax=Rhizobium lusitanum TaxID=293958 RepID=A0A6L9U4G0_9HYPH|nr:transporter [Rhizobium lusitanum]NEI68957.1 transporter [Rhizobium lusitanum]